MITKGEWKVYESPFAPAVIIDRPRRLIATCHLELGSEGMAEATANAYLVAAAPDMYEATQIALVLVRAVLYEHPDDAVALLQKYVIEKALAKAEGREE